MWCPKCRSPRQKTPKMGCRGRGGLRFGHNSVGHGASFACKPLNMRANPSMRTQTIEPAPGRRCPQACYRVNVRMRGPRCRPSGLRAVTGTRTATATATVTNQSNFACNSPVNLSRIEIASLQFQRFRLAQKTSSGELHATFRSGDHSRTTHSPADGGVTCAGARAPDNRPPHAPPLTFVMAPPASKGTSGPNNARAD